MKYCIDLRRTQNPAFAAGQGAERKLSDGDPQSLPEQLAESVAAQIDDEGAFLEPAHVRPVFELVLLRRVRDDELERERRTAARKLQIGRQHKYIFRHGSSRRQCHTQSEYERKQPFHTTCLP